MGKLIYITGYSGAGKTTIAQALQKELPCSIVLDGDVIRGSVSRDLGFDEVAKRENIRRNNALMAMLYAQGHTVIAAFMGSLSEERDKVFAECPNHLKVQLTTPLEVCVARDVKGLYRAAPANLAGISARYSPFDLPDIEINTSSVPVEVCVDAILHGVRTKCL